MKQKFNLGDEVIVNTGGEDSAGIIDYPTLKNTDGSFRNFHTNGELFLVRFTTDKSKCYCGGAKYERGSYKAEDNTLLRNAQFIPHQFIKPKP